MLRLFEVKTLVATRLVEQIQMFVLELRLFEHPAERRFT